MKSAQVCFLSQTLLGVVLIIPSSRDSCTPSHLPSSSPPPWIHLILPRSSRSHLSLSLSLFVCLSVCPSVSFVWYMWNDDYTRTVSHTARPLGWLDEDVTKLVSLRDKIVEGSRLLEARVRAHRWIEVCDGLHVCRYCEILARDVCQRASIVWEISFKTFFTPRTWNVRDA